MKHQVTDKFRLNILSSTKEIRRASRALFKYLALFHLNEDIRLAVRLSFEEALANAIFHGNESFPEKKIEVTADLQMGSSFSNSGQKKSLILTVKDEGKGFDYKNFFQKIRHARLNRPRKRGLLLITNLMDKVTFGSRGSCIRMVKYLRCSEKS